MTSLLGWWLLQWKALLYVSISVDIREVLWSILSVIQGCLWRFPFLLSRSRRWDHRTSLHRWQPRLKVSRSRGAYRLLARCEILPRMLFPACARTFITQRDGMSQLPTRGRGGKKPAIWCFIVLFFLFWLFSSKKRKDRQPCLVYFYWGMWLPGIGLSCLRFPRNIFKSWDCGFWFTTMS